jgi:RNA polymerase-interacting CarD/CdnL/TRCF family regulator
VLCDDPKQLPENHKDRYQFLEEKMYTGDILQVAEAVRDMAWRREQEGNLTTRGKRMYDEVMMLLKGEIAATQGIALGDAEAQILAKLKDNLTPSALA